MFFLFLFSKLKIIFLCDFVENIQFVFKPSEHDWNFLFILFSALFKASRHKNKTFKKHFVKRKILSVGSYPLTLLRNFNLFTCWQHAEKFSFKVSHKTPTSEIFVSKFFIKANLFAKRFHHYPFLKYSMNINNAKESGNVASEIMDLKESCFKSLGKKGKFSMVGWNKVFEQFCSRNNFKWEVKIFAFSLDIRGNQRLNFWRRKRWRW